jgi:hypothetical protein
VWGRVGDLRWRRRPCKE